MVGTPASLVLQCKLSSKPGKSPWKKEEELKTWTFHIYTHKNKYPWDREIAIQGATFAMLVSMKKLNHMGLRLVELVLICNNASLQNVSLIYLS